MGQHPLITREEDERVQDTVITNAMVLDYTGIYKADIAIRDGEISGIGKAGNPLIQDGVDIIVGAGTEVISGEGNIKTAGECDKNVRLMYHDELYIWVYG